MSAGEGPPAVRFAAVTKRYGETEALRGVGFVVERGEVFALVGPNGAGKTTALGILTGLLAPTSGSVEVFGVDVVGRPLEAKARTGFVPDRPFLWPRWTPRETLRFVGAVFGLSGHRLEETIDGELASFGISDVADRTNDTLSHGTRQKVALAQAFLHDPDLFVLDEPMVGLDPAAQRLLVERLGERTSGGAAVLLTTHHLSLAEEVARTVGVLVQGRLLATGPPTGLEAKGRPPGRLSEVFFELSTPDTSP